MEEQLAISKLLQEERCVYAMLVDLLFQSIGFVIISVMIGFNGFPEF